MSSRELRVSSVVGFKMWANAIFGFLETGSGLRCLGRQPGGLEPISEPNGVSYMVQVDIHGMILCTFGVCVM